MAPSISYACINAIDVQGDEAVRPLVKPQELLTVGKNAEARTLLGKHYFSDDQSPKSRVLPASARMRTPGAVGERTQWVTVEFAPLLAGDRENPRFQAALAAQAKRSCQGMVADKRPCHYKIAPSLITTLRAKPSS